MKYEKKKKQRNKKHGMGKSNTQLLLTGEIMRIASLWKCTARSILVYEKQVSLVRVMHKYSLEVSCDERVGYLRCMFFS